MYVVASESSRIETNKVILWQVGRSVLCVARFATLLKHILFWYLVD